MAGPSSYVPPPVTPSKTKRRFTLAQANKSLPLVSRIVRDIVAAHQRIVTLQSKNARNGGKERAPQRDLELEVDRLQGFVDELNVVGVELKDYQTGLVDFIGRHDGRDVYLCWKLGETAVTHWHELTSGFAGRQPVASLNETE